MKQLTIALTLILISCNVFADADRGQKHYLKYLRPYFGYNGQEFAQQHLKVEWKRYFKNDAEKFVKKYSKKHPDSESFLNSEKFLKIAPHIKDFASKYAADSGEIASCN